VRTFFRTASMFALTVTMIVLSTDSALAIGNSPTIW